MTREEGYALVVQAEVEIRRFARKLSWRIGGYYQQDLIEDYASLIRLRCLRAIHRYDPNRGSLIIFIRKNVMKEIGRYLDKEIRRGVQVPDREARDTPQIPVLTINENLLSEQIYQDFKEDYSSLDPQMQPEEFWETVKKSLGERDTAILRMKMYGSTLREIGKKFEISAERVRQIIEKSLGRLSTCKTLQALSA